MRILFIGDIIGRGGRDVVAAELPRLKKLLSPDFVIANGENAAGGFGLTRAVADDLFGCGIDCITTGNHWADQRRSRLIPASQPYQTIAMASPIALSHPG